MEELRAKQEEISKRDKDIKLLEAIIQTLGGKEVHKRTGQKICLLNFVCFSFFKEGTVCIYLGTVGLEKKKRDGSTLKQLQLASTIDEFCGCVISHIK